MIFGLKNVNFDHSHIGASSIKNILILGLILLSMARKMSKYVAKTKWMNNMRYLCCLKHLRVKLTLARLKTSFQTLPEIGLMTIYSRILFRKLSKESKSKSDHSVVCAHAIVKCLYFWQGYNLALSIPFGLTFAKAQPHGHY